MTQRIPRHARWQIVTIIAAALLLVRSAGSTAQNVEIAGAGATFPYPIYSAWFDEYTRMHPDLRISYQSIGSGDGIRQLRDLFVFFGAWRFSKIEA